MSTTQDSEVPSLEVLGTEARTFSVAMFLYLQHLVDGRQDESANDPMPLRSMAD